MERPDRTRPPFAWPLQVSTDMSTEDASSAVQEAVGLLIPILQGRAPRHGHQELGGSLTIQPVLGCRV